MEHLQSTTQLLSLSKSILDYENPDKLDFALEKLPLAQLFEEAETLVSSSEYGEEDLVIISLLKWFKNWFKWVNAAQCESCGHEQTDNVGLGDPSADDLSYGASTVELWKCPECNYVTRFPRYNDPVKLLETRRGRCGEWCNVMTLLLRALGRDVRYVWNSEDHVWNEIWSESQMRWIHVDSCEAAFDKPLTYADGWGKKMAYVIGFSVGGARDITLRYVRRPDAALPRSMFPELFLQKTLESITSHHRHEMDPVEEVEWYMRDNAETEELKQLSSTSTTQNGLLPRQSGSVEWTLARGEAGEQEGQK